MFLSPNAPAADVVLVNTSARLGQHSSGIPHIPFVLPTSSLFRQHWHRLCESREENEESSRCRLRPGCGCRACSRPSVKPAVQTEMLSRFQDQLTGDHAEPSRLATGIAAGVMTVFLVPGIAGNLWIIWLVIRRARLRANLINAFIASLCLNDAINLSLAQTLVLASYVRHGWTLGRFICALVPELNMVLVGVSLWHHALIALHRYLVVVKWLFYRHMNKTRYSVLVIVGSRAVPLLLSCIFLVVAVANSHDAPDVSSSSPSPSPSPSSTSPSSPPPSPSPSSSSSSSSASSSPSASGLRILAVLLTTLILPCLMVLIAFSLVFWHVRSNAVDWAKRYPRQMQPRDQITDRRLLPPPPSPSPSPSLPLSSSPTHLPSQTRTREGFGPSDAGQHRLVVPTSGPVDSDSNHSLRRERRYDKDGNGNGNDNGNGNGDRFSRTGRPLSKVSVCLEGASDRPKQASTASAVTNHHPSDKRRLARELTITVMFGVVFLLFLAGYVPYGIVRMFDSGPSHEARPTLDAESAEGQPRPVDPTQARRVPPDVYVLLTMLYAVASCCNPLIFGLINRDIRKEASLYLSRRRQPPDVRAPGHEDE
ncbi:unnamed protein product [Protopolystoma xenopodis]|uniref:G-protein coupled receptors family 1 profile domain-containing protein n=1 Tax=Protopolystoma xenopodis TaxID=117903 RepID=A0A3S5C8C9_9PLAT|nr:unnamed protein product [Protopolystoma xenopodis]